MIVDCVAALIVIVLTGWCLPEVASAVDVAGTTEEVADNDDEKWVRETAPGVRLYGRVPPFAEIGQSQMFDVAPDGQAIAFVAGTQLKFWDIDRRKLDGVIQLEANPQMVQYSMDGLRIYVMQFVNKVQPRPGTDDAAVLVPANHVVTVWDAITREKLATIDPSIHQKRDPAGAAGDRSFQQTYIRTLAVGPDDKTVALGFGDRTEVYQTMTGRMLSRIPHIGYSQFVTFSHDGDQIIDAQGRIVDVSTAEETDRLPAGVFGRQLNSLKVSPKRNLIAATAWNRGLILYDVDQGEVLELQQAGEDEKRPPFYMVEFSNNGKLVAAASYGGQFRPDVAGELLVWNVESGKLIERFDQLAGNLQRIRFSAQNDRLYTKVQGEYGLSVWEIDGTVDESNGSLRGNVCPISTFQFIGEKSIVAGSAPGAVIYDLESGVPERRIRQQQAAFLDTDEGNEYLVISGYYNSAQIFHLPTQKARFVELRSFQRPSVVSRLARFVTGKNDRPGYENFATNHVRIADDGHHVLVAGRSQRSFRVSKFELSSGTSVSRKQFKMDAYWPADPDDRRHINHWRPRSFTIAPNGQWLAIVNDQNDLFVIDAESGDVLNEIKGELQSPCQLEFTPDSAHLLVATGHEVRVWNTETGEAGETMQLGGQSDRIYLAISRDGRRMATVSTGGRTQLKIFCLETFAELHAENLREPCTGLGISADGERIALARDNCQFEVRELKLTGK